jgi:hypothetical protein
VTGAQAFDSIPLALGTGEGAVIVALLLMVLGVGFGLYSREGSELEGHPRGPERGDTAGSEADALDGDGELPGQEGRRFPGTRGTR